MTDHDELEALRAVLREQQRDAFAPGFADRAAARWREELSGGRVSAESALNRDIGRVFSRMVPIAAAAALLLAFYNVRHRAAGQNVLGALLGPSGAAVASAHASSSSAANTMMPLDEIYGLGALGGAGKE